MSNKENRYLRNWEADILFQEILNQKQKKIISRILIILGQYKLLDTDMLMKIYTKNYNEKLNIRYIKKAVKENLLVEYKKNLDTQWEQEIYFYELKEISFYVLEKAGYKNLSKNKIPIFWSNKERTRILTINKYLLEEVNDIETNFPKDFKNINEIYDTLNLETYEFGEYTKSTNPNYIMEV